MLLPLLLSLHKSLPTRGAPTDIAVKNWICMPILGAIIRFSVLTWMARGHDNAMAVLLSDQSPIIALPCQSVSKSDLKICSNCLTFSKFLHLFL